MTVHCDISMAMWALAGKCLKTLLLFYLPPNPQAASIALGIWYNLNPTARSPFSVLVSWGCYPKCHRLGDFQQHKCIVIALLVIAQIGKPKVKMLENPAFGGSCCLVPCSFSHCVSSSPPPRPVPPHPRTEKGKKHSWVSSILPFTRMRIPFWCSNRLSKAHSLNLMTWGQRFNMWVLWWMRS